MKKILVAVALASLVAFASPALARPESSSFLSGFTTPSGTSGRIMVNRLEYYRGKTSIIQGKKSEGSAKSAGMAVDLQ